MRFSFKKFACIFSFFLVIYRVSFAFDYPVSTYLGLDQGLSNNSVKSIFQDSNGFMWFGTNNGLNRWDGYHFQFFKLPVSERFSFFRRRITAINEDAQHNLWVGALWGVSVYSGPKKQFQNLFYIPSKGGNPLAMDDFVRGGIQVDKQNNIYIGTESLGLLYCKNATLVAKQIALEENGVKSYSYNVRCVKPGNGNKIWVFVQNKGLCLLDQASMTVRVVNSALVFANCLEVDSNKVWIGTPGGVYLFDILSNTCTKAFTTLYSKLSSEFVVSIIKDKNQKIWIGTNRGINIWYPSLAQMEFLQTDGPKYSLSTGQADAIFEDKESRKWIGINKGGIIIIDPHKQKFQTVTEDEKKPQGLKGNFVSALYQSPDKNLWIGTEDAGINIWNREKNTFVNYRYQHNNLSSLPSNFITCINSDHLNNIWIGTFTSGIARYQPATKNFKRYMCISSVTGVENPVIFALYEDKDKTLWAGALREGKKMAALYYYDKNADRFEVFDTALSDLFTIIQDREGNLWGGSIDHLVQIDKRKKKHRFFSFGYFIRALYEDRKGNFWVGTEGGGLFLFDKKKGKIVARHTEEDGLCNNTVMNILEDEQGDLWLSTFNGLSRFNPTQRTFKNYYKSDGLPSSQFNYNAATRLNDGELAFGGINGLTLFYPQKDGAFNNAKTIFLTGVRIGNSSLEQQTSFITKATTSGVESIKLPYDKAILSLTFAALEYSVPDKIQYAYYLEGWDRGWNYVGNNHFASYTHLSEGTYSFRVKSTNAEGIWGKEESKLTIVVLPPWYRSWWAYLLYITAIGGLVYSYLKYRAKQTRLQYEVKIATLNAQNEKAEREKEHAERETERILNEKEREINEKKISFFTNISHEFRTPLTLIINPVKELLEKSSNEQAKSGNELSIVYRNARRMLSLVDQLLLFRKAESGMDKIKPSKLNLHNLAYEVYLCFIQQAKSQNISYVFDCPNKNLEIYADREKLEIILYNLLSNALKYTPAGGEIKVTIEERAENVIIHVEDNGAGIPLETGEKLFDKFYKAERTKTSSKEGFGIGLFLVRHFTEQHGGAISYKSEESQGTVFTLVLLKGRDHFGPDVIISETDAAPAFLESFKEEASLQENITIDEKEPMAELVSEKKSILIIDDDESIRQYLFRLFKDNYIVYKDESGDSGLKTAQRYLPHLIISDIHMQGMNGIELCKAIRENAQLSHIPFVLLTGSTSDELKLHGVEGGADDYIVKPFDSKLLLARVGNLLKNRNTLQKYFYNEVTLNKNDSKISPEYKEFLDKCISVVETHLKDKNFTVQTLLNEMGMSHSNLLRKVKSVSGQPVNVFIRSIRLRKAAELFINTDYSIKETAYMVGVNDIKYFREQFNKLFGMNPSDYIKRYRKVHGKQYTVNKESLDPDN